MTETKVKSAETGEKFTISSRIVTKNEDYNFRLSDTGRTLAHDSDSSHTWTICPQTAVNWPLTATIDIMKNAGSGSLTIGRGSGVSLYLASTNTDGDITLPSSERVGARIRKVAEDIWVMEEFVDWSNVDIDGGSIDDVEITETDLGPSVLGVRFDGLNAYLSKPSDLDGNSDSKVFTFACRFRINGVGGTSSVLFASDDDRFFVSTEGNNKIRIIAKDVNGTAILDQTTSTAVAVNGNGHTNLLISANMATDAKAQVYINDSLDSAAASTFTDAAIDFTRPDHLIMRTQGGSFGDETDMNFLFLDVTQKIDFSVEANRRFFFDEGGGPIGQGSDGSKNTGQIPIVYLTGDKDEFATNKGSGGGFTENGTLTNVTNPQFRTTEQGAYFTNATGGGQGEGTLNVEELYEAGNRVITSASNLADLNDVTITSVADNEVLAYDNASGEWINQTPDEANLADLDGAQTLTNKTITNPVFDDYLDISETTEPSDPGANTARLFNLDEGGFSTLHWKNGSGTDHEISRDTIHVVRNVSGGVLSKGEVVYITGSNGVFPTVDKAKANSNSTMPAFGVVINDISNNSFGQVQQAGDLGNLDTSAFTEGQILYVSASTAGGLTATAPTGTDIPQRVAIATKINAGSGILSVIVGSELDPGLTATLTNKTVNLTNNTLTGTKAEFNTALSDGNFAYSGGAFHDGFSDFVANEHIDWTSASEDLTTSGIINTGDGTVSAPAYSFGSDTDTGMYLPIAGQLRFTSGGTDHLVLLNNLVSVRNGIELSWGNNADTRLSRDSGDILAQVRSSNAQEYRIYNNIDGNNLERAFLSWKNTADVLQIGTEAGGNGTQRPMNLVANGVGIGTDTPAASLNVEDSPAGVVALLDNQHASTPDGLTIDFSAASPDDNTQFFLKCEDSTTTRALIYSDGDLQNHDNSYGAISDKKLKQDIVYSGSQWEDIKNIARAARKFRFKTDVAENGDKARQLLGLVAQELEKISPGLVRDNPDTETVEEQVTDKEGDPLYKSVYEIRRRQRTVDVPVLDQEGNEVFEEVEVTVDEKVNNDGVLIPKHKEMQTWTKTKTIGVIDQDGNPVMENYEEEIGEEPIMRRVSKPTGTYTKSIRYSILYMKAVKALGEALERIEKLENNI